MPCERSWEESGAVLQVIELAVHSNSIAACVADAATLRLACVSIVRGRYLNERLPNRVRSPRRIAFRP